MPVVKKNVALLTSCFDIVRPTTPKIASRRQRESRAAAHVHPQSREAQRGAEIVVLEGYDSLIEPVNHAASESAISSAPLPNTAPREK